MVYLAETRSLASLEVLAHTDDRSLLNHMDYVVIPVVLEDGHVLDISPGKLPSNWAAVPTSDATQLLGEKWLTGGTSVGLRVPSVVTKGEFNILLNPNHPDFKSLKFGAPESYPFDNRIAR